MYVAQAKECLGKASKYTTLQTHFCACVTILPSTFRSIRMGFQRVKKKGRRWRKFPIVEEGECYITIYILYLETTAIKEI